MLIAYVMLGGALGSALRFWLISTSGLFLRHVFPYATLTVNILGSFCAGLAVAYIQNKLADHSYATEIRAFLIIGILGGFTTFSTYSLEVVDLYIKGYEFKAITYAMLSILLSVMATFLGLSLIR